MPTTEAQQISDFADEIFELSKAVWASQSRNRGREQAEVTESEFLALDVLAKASGPLNVGEIQRTIGVLPAQMSRLIRSLENKGSQPLVACRINAGDKRKIDVELTAAGRKTHVAYRQYKLGSILKMLESLSGSDRHEFMRIMRVIRETARK